MSADEEIRFQDEEYYPWIPDGQYRATCIRYSDPVRFRGTRKVFLHFEIQTEPYAGETIFGAFDVGFNGITPGSRYFKSWCTANDDHLPSRNALMSPRIFKGKTFMITTRTVHQDRPQVYWYSVVNTVDSLDSPDNQEDSTE